MHRPVQLGRKESHFNVVLYLENLALAGGNVLFIRLQKEFQRCDRGLYLVRPHSKEVLFIALTFPRDLIVFKFALQLSCLLLLLFKVAVLKKQCYDFNNKYERNNIKCKLCVFQIE